MDGDNENSDIDENIEIVELDDSRYSTSIHVPKNYLAHIRGYKQQTKISIERETDTVLKIPEVGQHGDITIMGSTAESVKAARLKIQMKVVSSRMDQKPTHFISIPMNKSDIMDNFTRFQETVLRDCQNRGLDESIFIKPSKLHLTVGVMCLTDDEEKTFASNLLLQAKEKVIMPLLRDHLPLKIRIKGLSHMGNDPRKVNVLYANIGEHESTPGILQQLADRIVDFYGKKGYVRWDDGALFSLIELDYVLMYTTDVTRCLNAPYASKTVGLMNKNEFGRDSVRMHVTLLNIKYRNKSKDVRVRNKRIPFDGSDILDKFGDFDFGVLELMEIHLSHMGAIGPDGYYEAIFKISIP